MQRASWKMRTGTIDTALADCDLALELARGEFASRRTEASQLLLALALNQRAYAYALADATLKKRSNRSNKPSRSWATTTICWILEATCT